MKVALFFPSCNRRGGIERIVLETANFLAGRGHDVHLCACRWDKEALDPRVTIHAVPAGRGPAPLPALSFARHSRRVAAKINADIRGCFGVYCPPDAVFWAGSVHRAWIETSRGQRDLWGRLRQRLNPFHPVMLAFERYYLGGHRYRRLIAYTDQVKEDFIHYYGVVQRDIAIIPCGFAAAEFSLTRRAELRAPARARLGYRDGDKVILLVANELHRKGLSVLLHAMKKVTGPNEKLLVVGRASPAPFLGEIQSLGLAERVQFAGSSGNVAEFYSAADLFALPTQYEPWGLVIVEALACGLPVLTSRLAGAAVAVRDGETGLLLDDPRDIEETAVKLRRLLDGHRAGAEEIAASVSHLSWPSVLSRYESVLMECAGAGAAAGEGQRAGRADAR